MGDLYEFTGLFPQESKNGNPYHAAVVKRNQYNAEGQDVLRRLLEKGEPFKVWLFKNTTGRGPAMQLKVSALDDAPAPPSPAQPDDDVPF
ncbi:hypothetical protein KKG46_05955 [Patescibacteria group bacterium]|nr:hypothetical protein [Patescibacteria group bacterium]